MTAAIKAGTIALGFYVLNKFVGDIHLTILYFSVLACVHAVEKELE